MKILKKFTKEELKRIAETETKEMFLWRKNEDNARMIPIAELAKIALNAEKEPLDKETVLKTADFYTRNEYILRILASTLGPNSTDKIVIELPPENSEKSNIVWPDREYAMLLSRNVIKTDLQDEEYQKSVLYVVM